MRIDLETINACFCAIMNMTFEFYGGNINDKLWVKG